MEKKFSTRYNISMIYIIKGEEKHLIKDKLKEFSSTDRSLVKLDGQSVDFTIAKMVDACKQIDLFADFNTVLVKDAPFLIDKYDGKDINIKMDVNRISIYNNTGKEVYLILDKLFDKRIYEVKDTKYVNLNGLKGKYTIYYRIDGKVYKTDYYIEV